MKTTHDSVISAHHLSVFSSEGMALFNDLKFKVQRLKYGFLFKETRAQEVLFQILSRKMQPQEGTLLWGAQHILSFCSPPDLALEQTIADELGQGEQVRALRRIQQGNSDSEALQILAEAWDVEDQLSAALTKAGLSELDLLHPFSQLDPDDQLRVRLAAIDLHQAQSSGDPLIVVWNEPVQGLSPEGRNHLAQAIEICQGPLILLCSQESEVSDLLAKVDFIWMFSETGLQEYQGNYQAFLRAQEVQIAEANAKLEKARSELAHRLSAAHQAHEKRRARRDRAQQFADTGTPKVHRGNMKRKSQESLAKAKSADFKKVQEAEEQFKQASEHLERLQSMARTGSV